MFPERGEPGWEVEWTFAVCSGNRAETLVRFRNLAVLGGASLRPGPNLDLDDRYYDTAGGDLGRNRFALRLRRSGGDFLLALKGPSRRVGEGPELRLEMEYAWSPGAYAEIVRELRSRGIEPAGGGGAPAGPESLEAAGWRSIHRRRTRRKILLAAHPDGGAPSEIALDLVEFPLPDLTIRHLEIEIEGHGPAAVERVRTLAAAAGRLAGAGLRPWPHGKLMTGSGLVRMGRAGVLGRHLDDEGWLDENGYTVLERDYL
jgi:hypothetical protein